MDALLRLLNKLEDADADEIDRMLFRIARLAIKFSESEYRDGKCSFCDRELTNRRFICCPGPGNCLGGDMRAIVEGADEYAKEVLK